MQKKLIALAIAGLSTAAFAQSNVTISGQVKAGYESYKLSGSSAAAATNTNGTQNLISDETSKIVFSGSEGLGNGLSAIFQIDTRFAPDTGATATNTFGGGNTHVGLKSDSLGEFKIGRADLHYNEIERIEGGANGLSQQAMVGRGIMNKVNGVDIGGTAQTRTNNLVFWDSPNWNGFTARVAYSTNPAGAEGATGPTNNDKGGLYNLVARYEANNIKAGISYLDYQVEGSGQAVNSVAVKQKSVRAWGSYTLPMGLQVGLAYDQSQLKDVTGLVNVDDNFKRNAWAIPVSYNFGNHGIYATYAKAQKLKGSGVNGAISNNSDAKQWTLGYDYAFSKRTSVGVNYTKLTNSSDALYNFGSNKGTAIAQAGQDASQVYAGINHKF